MFADRAPDIAGELTADLAALNRKYFRRVKQWWEEHVATGELRPMPIQIAIAQWIGPAHYFGGMNSGGSRKSVAGRAAEIELLCQASSRALCAS